MCGIVGILSQRRVNQDIFDALTILQHRGQDAAGMLTSDEHRIYLRKSNGLVRDAIRENHMQRLHGTMGIGHVRYPTAGSTSPTESQPFYVNSPYGLSLVHNGNLTNTTVLAEDLIRTDMRHLNTFSDSEVLLNVVAHELQHVAAAPLQPKYLFKAMGKVYQRVQGAFAATLLIHGYGVVGFRDPYGIRPIVFGKREGPKGTEFMFASESIALDALGFELIGDVAPGEVVYFDKDGHIHRQICAVQTQLAPCIFEYIYLARPDSILQGVPVYKARNNMGKFLAKKIALEWPDHKIDVVIPIPDTSRNAALSLSHHLNIPYSEGFVKNRYIGRTFIMPGQEMRRSSVRLKLNAIKSEFAGKRVLLIDDSIVRGTTSKEIIQMAREAGALSVYFASAAPEIRYPNVYGIDMACRDELVAYGKTTAEIAHTIGADKLFYQNLADVYKSIQQAEQPDLPEIQHLEDSVFTGKYISDNITEEFLSQLAFDRNDAAKKKKYNLDDDSIENLS